MVLVIMVRQYRKYKVAPELELSAIEMVTLQGEPANLAQLHTGKNILLTYFATWCGPCHAEVAPMEAARPLLESNGFVLVHASDEDADKIVSFASKNPSGIVYYRSAVALENLGVHTYPTHFVFDKKGQLRFKQTDPLQWQNPATVQEIIDVVKEQ